MGGAPEGSGGGGEVTGSVGGGVGGVRDAVSAGRSSSGARGPGTMIADSARAAASCPAGTWSSAASRFLRPALRAAFAAARVLRPRAVRRGGGDSQGGGSCTPRLARKGRAGGADGRSTGGRVSGHRSADLAEARHTRLGGRVGLVGLVGVRNVEDLVVGGEAARGALAPDPAEVPELLQLPQGGGHTVAPFGPESGELAYRGPAAVREPEEVREDAHRRPRKVLVARRGVGETGERALGRATVNAHSGRSSLPGVMTAGSGNSRVRPPPCAAHRGLFL